MVLVLLKYNNKVLNNVFISVQMKYKSIVYDYQQYEIFFKHKLKEPN